jgi:hypothetical protein
MGTFSRWEVVGVGLGEVDRHVRRGHASSVRRRRPMIDVSGATAIRRRYGFADPAVRR